MKNQKWINKPRQADAASASTLSLLQSYFNALAIGVDELSKVTGEQPQSIRNAINQKRYPIVSFRAGPRRRFMLTEVAKYIDSEYLYSAMQQAATSTKVIRDSSDSKPSTAITDAPAIGGKRRRGRPTIAEQMARQQTNV